MSAMAFYVFVVDFRMVESRVSALVICKEVMVEGCILSSPDAPVAVAALAVNGIT